MATKGSKRNLVATTAKAGNADIAALRNKSKVAALQALIISSAPVSHSGHKVGLAALEEMMFLVRVEEDNSRRRAPLVISTKKHHIPLGCGTVAEL